MLPKGNFLKMIDYPEYEGSEHCIYTQLAKLDSLASGGCADKFLQTHAKRWESGMPRPGDLIHSEMYQQYKMTLNYCFRPLLSMFFCIVTIIDIVISILIILCCHCTYYFDVLFTNIVVNIV